MRLWSEFKKVHFWRHEHPLPLFGDKGSCCRLVTLRMYFKHLYECRAEAHFIILKSVNLSIHLSYSIPRVYVLVEHLIFKPNPLILPYICSTHLKKLSRYFSDLGIVQTSWVLPEQIFSIWTSLMHRKGPSEKGLLQNVKGTIVVSITLILFSFLSIASEMRDGNTKKD